MQSNVYSEQGRTNIHAWGNIMKTCAGHITPKDEKKKKKTLKNKHYFYVLIVCDLKSK